MERRYSIATSGLAVRREVNIPPGILQGRQEAITVISEEEERDSEEAECDRWCSR